MNQIIARRRIRAQMVQQVSKYYIDDFEDNSCALEALQYPSDLILDWEQVKRELLLLD